MAGQAEDTRGLFAVSAKQFSGATAALASLFLFCFMIQLKKNLQQLVDIFFAHRLVTQIAPFLLVLESHCGLPSQFDLLPNVLLAFENSLKRRMG